MRIVELESYHDYYDLVSLLFVSETNSLNQCANRYVGKIQLYY